MPVTKSAKKKLRIDRKIERENKKLRAKLLKAVKSAKKNPNLKKYSLVQKTIDKAARRSLIHKNKAARLKSSIAKLLPKSAKKPRAKA